MTRSESQRWSKIGGIHVKSRRQVRFPSENNPSDCWLKKRVAHARTDKCNTEGIGRVRKRLRRV
ncbi:hypothetical protein BCR44DRAFT_1446520 [Catenaria anguillulae PL171]|uniref:Uncharacterized protein n=1 Tax=Catenaria anguillulae PL171 TaxID=765915 RepID=A0A1Y2H8L2_9FUNG|nr:hypothetical protein BCR44DRAFT_1446520 [Catenaria anguillulae PL171]